jgi:hypothetical protein
MHLGHPSCGISINAPFMSHSRLSNTHFMRLIRALHVVVSRVLLQRTPTPVALRPPGAWCCCRRVTLLCRLLPLLPNVCQVHVSKDYVNFTLWLFACRSGRHFLATFHSLVKVQLSESASRQIIHVVKNISPCSRLPVESTCILPVTFLLLFDSVFHHLFRLLGWSYFLTVSLSMLHV